MATDPPAPKEQSHLVFGLVASSPNGRVAAAFDELADWLRDHTDVTFDLRVAPSYKELAASVREASSDVAWLPPVAYAWLVEAVTPLGTLMRQGETTYSSVLLVRHDSDVRTLDDVRGRRAGWVDPWSAAGYVVPRIELARAGFESASTFAEERFFGSHRETLAALGAGQCDVAATYARLAPGDEAAIEGPWTELESAMDVRVLATFGPIPPDVLAVRRNLAPELYERARIALRAACEDATGRALMMAVFGGAKLDDALAGHDTLRIAYESAMARGIFD